MQPAIQSTDKAWYKSEFRGIMPYWLGAAGSIVGNYILDGMAWNYMVGGEIYVVIKGTLGLLFVACASNVTIQPFHLELQFGSLGNPFPRPIGRLELWLHKLVFGALAIAGLAVVGLVCHFAVRLLSTEWYWSFLVPFFLGPLYVIFTWGVLFAIIIRQRIAAIIAVGLMVVLYFVSLLFIRLAYNIRPHLERADVHDLVTIVFWVFVGSLALFLSAHKFNKREVR